MHLADTVLQRAYAAKIAGIPLETTYDMDSLRFKLRFINPTPPSSLCPPPVTLASIAADYASPLGMIWPATPTVGEPVRSRITEIHLPRRLYGVAHSDGLLRVRVGAGEVGNWSYDVEVCTASLLACDGTDEFVDRNKLCLSLMIDSRLGSFIR